MRSFSIAVSFAATVAWAYIIIHGAVQSPLFAALMAAHSFELGLSVNGRKNTRAILTLVQMALLVCIALAGKVVY